MTVLFGDMTWAIANEEIAFPVFTAGEKDRPGTPDIMLIGDVERAMPQDYTLQQDFTTRQLARERIDAARRLAMQTVLIGDQHGEIYYATVGGVAAMPIKAMANGEFRVKVRFRIAVDWDASIQEINA